MKFGHRIRNSFAAAALSMAVCIPAQAALLLLPAGVDQSVVGDQAFDYTFTPAQSGVITATLTDLLNPVAFDFLSFQINSGPTPITPPPVPVGTELRTFSFGALANTVYSLTVFAGSGSFQGHTAPHFFGKYHLAVSEPVPVPEPGVWLLMLGGIGLLGWMRLRKSESFG
jgi:hypothetical protein